MTLTEAQLKVFTDKWPEPDPKTQKLGHRFWKQDLEKFTLGIQTRQAEVDALQARLDAIDAQEVLGYIHPRFPDGYQWRAIIGPSKWAADAIELIAKPTKEPS